jgi:hypothetical protein
VGRVHILSETNVLVCARPDRSERYESWLPQEWDVTSTCVLEAVGSIVADSDLLVVTDRALQGDLGEALAQRPRRREEEAMLGMILDEGFEHVQPNAELTAHPGRETFETTARRLRTRSAYDAALREYYSLVDCLSAMEANRASSMLADDPVYERVVEAEEIQTDRVESLRDRLLEFGDDVAFTPPRERSSESDSCHRQ